MSGGFDNTWGVLNELVSRRHSFYFYPISFNYVTDLLLLIFFSAHARLEISEEQESFLKRVWAIPLK